MGAVNRAIRHVPYFAQWPLSEITIEAVDAYRRFKIAQAEARRVALEREDAELRECLPRPLHCQGPLTGPMARASAESRPCSAALLSRCFLSSLIWKQRSL